MQDTWQALSAVWIAIFGVFGLDRIRDSDRPRPVDAGAGWLRSACDHPDDR